VLLFSVVAHEYAHAWTAYRQGDPTAHLLGRLTLNPLPHIDPMMSVLFPLMLFLVKSPFIFGAAKPVPVNPANFRNYRRGDLIVSSAGIVANLLLAAVSAGLFVAIGAAGAAVPGAMGVLGTLQRMALFGILVNVTLGLFNLIPLPPLDGSHLFYHLLPPALGARYRALGRFGFALLLVVFMVPGLRQVIWVPMDAALRLTFSAVGGYALPGVIR
jgi:Zn-dependent protease